MNDNFLIDKETKKNLLRHVRRSEFKAYPLLHEQTNDVAVSVQTCWQLCVLAKHSLTTCMEGIEREQDTGILEQE